MLVDRWRGRTRWFGVGVCCSSCWASAAAGVRRSRRPHPVGRLPTWTPGTYTGVAPSGPPGLPCTSGIPAGPPPPPDRRSSCRASRRSGCRTRHLVAPSRRRRLLHHRRLSRTVVPTPSARPPVYVPPPPDVGARHTVPSSRAFRRCRRRHRAVGHGPTRVRPTTTSPLRGGA